MSVIYSFLKYVRYGQIHTSSGKFRNTQLRFGSPRRDPFFDPSPPLFGFRTTGLGQRNTRVKLQRQVFLNFSAEP